MYMRGGYVAYFSMEVGLNRHMPTYSGGLGILAGDTLKSFADIGVNVVGVTLLNEKGYFDQEIDWDGNQTEKDVEWNVEESLELLDVRTSVRIENRDVHIRVWKYTVKGINGEVPVLFLDTNVEENNEYDRTLTSHLYGGDRYYRLCQEIILGIGGMRVLDLLKLPVRKYHMNEGHAALLTVELYKKTCEDVCDVDYTKDTCVFTTHTPVAAGHDRFPLDLFKRVLGDYVPDEVLVKCVQDDKLNMTLLGLELSHYVNGVAKRHQEVTMKMFPGHHISSVTNGVHPETWVSDAFADLFSRYLPGWDYDPFVLRNTLTIPKEKIWAAHVEQKKKLMKYVNEFSNLGFDHRRFTIGFARRFTAYKRPDLLLMDINRLKAIAEKVGDIQVVFAGKAHKSDWHGKEIIKHVVQLSHRINAENGKVKIIFLPNYNMHIAKMLVSGCDVWLNNPQRPYEASGTSGMKAAMNGVPQVSTLDGWWLEGHIEHMTGWSIGPHPHDDDFSADSSWDDEANDLYNKLEHVIIPTFYGNNKQWLKIMTHCIAINASFFNTHRMVRQYIVDAYR